MYEENRIQGKNERRKKATIMNAKFTGKWKMNKVEKVENQLQKLVPFRDERSLFKLSPFNCCYNYVSSILRNFILTLKLMSEQWEYALWSFNNYGKFFFWRMLCMKNLRKQIKMLNNFLLLKTCYYVLSIFSVSQI